MPELRMDDRQLGAALADLGAHIAYPPVADVRAAVAARLGERRPAVRWRRLATPRALVPALVALALLLTGVVVLSPEARAAAADILRLRGVEIFRGPVPTPSPAPTRSPGAAPSPSASPSLELTLGAPVGIEDARAGAGYPVVLPSDALLGQPDQTYLRALGPSTQVSFVYRLRPGIQPSPVADIAALFSEFGGATVDEQFFGKVIDRGTTVEKLTIDGQPGFWIEGQPHFFFYRVGGAGQVQQEALRLVGNTLIWQRDGLVLRLEAQVDRATALRIAGSVR